MSNVIQFRPRNTIPKIVLQYECGLYSLSLLDTLNNELQVVEQWQGKAPRIVAKYKRLICALNFYYKHKEASTLVVA